MRVLYLCCEIFNCSNFHSFYFRIQSVHTKYTKISTIRKFPTISTYLKRYSSRYSSLPQVCTVIPLVGAVNRRGQWKVYRIAGKFGNKFNLVVWQIDTPTAKLKSAKIKS